MRAIFFDLDNTLVDRDGAADRWLLRQLPERELAEARAVDAGGRASRATFCAWLAAKSPALGPTTEAVWDRFRSELPQTIEPEADVLDSLRSLSERYELAVVSNGGADLQRAKMTAAGLQPRFRPERVFISEEVGTAKPDAGIYRRALDALDVSPHEALFVGDHEVHDVAAPAALGLSTCWVRGRRSGAAPDSDLEITRVPELLEHLR